jgi:predicted alpha-1,6-mannanase (GH76 family)
MAKSFGPAARRFCAAAKKDFGFDGSAAAYGQSMNDERPSDFELLQRFARHGDQGAFAGVVRQHVDLVFATARRKVEDQGAAEEVAQNVFAALVKKAWQCAPDDSLPAWLYPTSAPRCCGNTPPAG